MTGQRSPRPYGCADTCPLAIILLAARLAHHPAWDLTTFTDEFATAQDRLGELEADNRAVAAAFDLSYRDLPPHLQRLFRHLGLHPGPDIDPYATAALADIPLAKARRHLETLYADHLIEEPARHRYWLHDLLREYAHTLTTHDPADTRAQATDRLLTYYTHTAETADHRLNTTPRPHTTPAPDAAPELTTHGDALAWMRTEYPNLLACARHTAGHTHPTHLIALANAMAVFLRQQGPWDQAITLHRTAAETAHLVNDAHNEAGSLRELGRVLWLTGDNAGAAELAEQALDLFRALGDRSGEANALWDLGRVRLGGDYAGAAELFEQALDVFRALGDRLGEANALRELGRVRWLMGAYTGVTELAEQALDLFRALGDRNGEAGSLRDLGRVLWLTGDYVGAAGLAEQALDLYRVLGNRLGEANALPELSQVRQLMGDYVGAAGLAERALDVCRDLGDRLGEANALRELGEVRRLMGDYVGAAGLAERALDLYRVLGNRQGEAFALHELGMVRTQVGDFEAASKLLARSHSLFKEVGDMQGEVEALNSTGDLLAESDGQAIAVYQQALFLARQIRSFLGEAHALEGIARCQARTDSTHQAAIATLREAVAVYQRLGAAEAPAATEYLARLEAGQA
ncbi:tetratricopeptide repeat protein [Streptomyces sp. NPDC059679]|uniref:tetratricopeptide repeat protein n=1 Tax=Streptomyces sp. NPDC059679 TaxID=3346903 RepID=UPI0036A15446